MQYRIIRRNMEDSSVVPITDWFAGKEYAEKMLTNYWSENPQYRYELETRE